METETSKKRFNKFEIILGSSSPRRQAFFKALEIPFTIDVRSIDEQYPLELKANEITEFLAKAKSKPYTGLNDKQILITSDTIVWHKDQALLKPKNKEQAINTIQKLSNKTHQVITSVAFTTQKQQYIKTDTTNVTFEQLDLEEIKHYVNQYKPFDKAGAYGIQEWIGLIGISKIEGSYNTVVGLPTHLVYQTLKKITK